MPTTKTSQSFPNGKNGTTNWNRQGMKCAAAQFFGGLNSTFFRSNGNARKDKLAVTMDEKKISGNVISSGGGRHCSGSKVSQIANIFQNRNPASQKDSSLLNNEAIITRNVTTKSATPDIPLVAMDRKEIDVSPTQVTVVRTESHVARFNNARALFEKLGEENRTKLDTTKMIPLQGTKSASSIHIRSRSSSANSETNSKDIRSRSPSPGKTRASASDSSSNQSNINFSQFSNSVPVLTSDGDIVTYAAVIKPKKSNGHHHHHHHQNNLQHHNNQNHHIQRNQNVRNGRNNDTDDDLDSSEYSEIVFNGLSETTKSASSSNINVTPAKPSVLPRKPDKPERKFNSRELIEKQRNWTSHFSKARSTRYNSDPNKNDVRLGLNNSATKTSVTSSSTSQLHQNQSHSVDEDAMSNCYTNLAGSGQPAMRSASFSDRVVHSPPTSPPPPPIRTESSKRSVYSARIKDRPSSVIPVQEQKSRKKSGTECLNNTDNRAIDTNTFVRSPLPLKDKYDDFVQYPLPPRPVSSASISPKSPHSTSGTKPFAASDEVNKENLSASADSLASSISTPSSPSRQKTEDEKQERESNEKLSMDSSDDVIFADADEDNRNSGCLDKQPSENEFETRKFEDAIESSPSHGHKRTPKMISSIALNIPAAGLGPRPASIISTSSTTTDEGGFNEPSPEIKAKLKPYEDDVSDLVIPPGQNRTLPSSNVILLENSVLTRLDRETGKPPPPDLVSDFLNHERQAQESMEPMRPLFVQTNQQEPGEIACSSELDSKENLDRPIVDSSSEIATKSLTPNSEFKDDGIEVDDGEIATKAIPPFLVSRTILREDKSSCAVDGSGMSSSSISETQKSEASILDLQDVEFVDASDEEDDTSRDRENSERVDTSVDTGVDVTSTDSHGDNNSKKVTEADTMTPDEAENLLSASILEKKIRQEALLSDEEAQEVVRLLSPADKNISSTNYIPSKSDQSFWMNSTSGMNDSVLTVDSTTADSTSSRLTDSVTGSESGIIGSVSSLNDTENIESQEEFIPIPGKIIIVENGVHYYEDGHFWMEVPGLPESEDDDDLDYPIYTKKTTKVTFSKGPMKVYSTFSVNDYDRRNEDVDPVAASAEYELEKRVEKMEVFPVELIKGPEGLGLSIIGMGVGADAGLEKLGIFVKTITENGAAARDRRIQVNDQIIEVDGKSLVGVTQAYAASVLRNTSGLVKFLIGREKDPQNSEVAQLIRQSLQADREREERHMRPNRVPLNDTSQSEDSSATLPLNGSANTSISDGPVSPSTTTDSVFENEQTNNDVDSLRILLQENQQKLASSDVDVNRLKAKLMEMETAGTDKEDVSEKLRQTNHRLRETERNLNVVKKEAANYQDMLEQSQSQYSALEKKYNKAKKLVREFQQRELDMAHREEFYQQLLQEKDTEYNALVKNLKDRVISLEQDLLETQRKAGFPVRLPYDSISSKPLTPQMTRRPAPKPLFQQIETELSDTEISDVSPEDGDKTATVERKMPIKEELDRAIPQHELLDVSANKLKGELGQRGGLANRQLPSGKKGNLSNSSSEYTLDESCENSCDESIDATSTTHLESSFSSDSHSLNSSSTTTTQIQRPNSLTNISSRITSSTSSVNAIYSHVNKEHLSGANNEHWTGGSNSRPTSAKGLGPPSSLAEQLKQVLAEREKRLGEGPSPRDNEEKIKAQNTTLVTQHLVEEIRMAVNEANARVKKVVPQTLSPPGSVPWQHQNPAPPSPSSLSSGSISPAGLSPIRHDVSWTPSHHSDLNLSISSISSASDKRSHFWHNGPVSEWSKEQVCQWLLALGLEQHITKFLEHQVGGMALLQLDSRDFKILGINGDDKNRLKRKLKELKIQVEKEKRQVEKEKKERERMMRKAEKMAEKASKKK